MNLGAWGPGPPGIGNTVNAAVPEVIVAAEGSSTTNNAEAGSAEAKPSSAVGKSGANGKEFCRIKDGGSGGARSARNNGMKLPAAVATDDATDGEVADVCNTAVSLTD